MHALRSLCVLAALPALALGIVGVARSAAPLPTFEIDLPHEFAAGQPARASEVNANFSALTGAVEQRADEVDASLALLGADLDSLGSRADGLELELADLPRPRNVIVVAEEGGHFTSVVDALASISDASLTNRYLVQVAPGVYEESTPSIVPSFVTLRGASAASTVVRGSILANSPTQAASVVFLESDSALVDLTVENTGSSLISIAVCGIELSRATRMQNVVARANGSGGTGHFAVHVSESDLALVDCVLFASGASTVDTAFGSIDSGGPFAQPLLRGCDLEGDGANSGIGAQISSTALQMDDCRVLGDWRAISASVNGISTIRNSRIASLGLSPVYEQTGSASILSGAVFFVGGNPLGFAASFKYAWCIKANFDPVANGTGSNIEA